MSFLPTFNFSQDDMISDLCAEDPFCVHDRMITGTNAFALETLGTVRKAQQVEELSRSGMMDIDWFIGT